MCNYWAERDCQVTLVSLRGDIPDHFPTHKAVNRVTVDYYWRSKGIFSRPKDQVIRIRRLRRALLDTQPTIVISFIDRINIRVLVSLYGTKIPVIVSERADPRMDYIGVFWNSLRRVLYPRAAAIVAQTQTVADWFTDTQKITNVDIIANPVSKRDSPPSSDRAPLVVAVGRLTKQKGIDLLLQSWAEVNTHANWQLSILGDGDQREELEALSLSLKLTDTVRFHGNVSDPDEVLQQAAIFVLPSRYEGFPNALLEAMACGLAAISFNCPSGPADIIRQDFDGLLVPAEDTKQLSQAIQRLIDDQPLRETLSRNALTVTDRYSQERIMSEWDQIISRSVAD